MVTPEIPCDLEAEKAVLGACMLSIDAAEIAIEELATDAFYSPVHGELWAVISSLVESGMEPTVFAVRSRLGKTLEMVGGDSALAALQGSCVPFEIRTYVRQVKEFWLRRRAVLAAHNILLAASDSTGAELVEHAQSLAVELGEMDPASLKREFEKNALAMAGLEFCERLRNNGGVAEVRAPWTRWNSATRGFPPGHLVIIAARPGKGKTTMALNIAAENEDIGGVFYTLEVTAEELSAKYLAMRAGVDMVRFSQLPAGPEVDAESKGLVAAADRLQNSKIAIVEASGWTATKIATHARRWARKRGIKFVIVDYIQLIRSQRAKNEQREEEVAKISLVLKQLAIELKIPVIALAQLNRAAELAGREPRKGDLRESGSLENDAHVVALLHEPDSIDDGMPALPASFSPLKVILDKNRFGPTEDIWLAYKKSTGRIMGWMEAIRIDTANNTNNGERHD